MADKSTVRGLLLSLGVSDWNANMIIPYMFITPSTTDPSMAQVIVLTRYIQRALIAVGGGALGVQITGSLDEPTGNAIAQAMGTNSFLSLPWYEIVTAILNFNDAGLSLVPPESSPGPSGVGDFSLPDVPGGAITYGLGAFALWYFLIKKKKRSGAGKPRF